MAERTTHYYPTVNPNPDFPALEESVLAFWEKDNLFRRSVSARPAKKDGVSNEFIFYDGPPFANGLPHYGHLLTGYVKDLVARYQTMQGKRVERRFGWDCHGLPAEMGEKELGISGRQAIINYGIEKFNTYCRTSVMRYTDEWHWYVTRQGRWVDFQGDYKTMDTNFMESVIWAFKQLYDKGLCYEAYRVMPYSWAAETPLSNFETKLDNSYRDREDKAITVAFELKDIPDDAKESLAKVYNNKSPFTRCHILAWTTTPWTLPSNLALAVNAEIMYQYVHKNNELYIASKNYIDRSLEDLKKAGFEIGFPNDHLLYVTPTETWFKEITYKPLFPYFENHEEGINPETFNEEKARFRILDGSSFVTDSDGTGVVHIAPGFGEEDQKVAQANGIYIVCPVDGQGKYTDEIYDLPDLSLKGLNVIAQTEGQNADEPYKPEQVKKYGLANLRIINWLKNNGQLIKQEEIKHSYPHCWRTDTPLIYRAMPSWYVEVTKFRDRAVEINQQINWIPEHVRDGQMGHMLATAPDWSISRNRFWGTPIPVWRSKSGKIKVFGSIAEIEAASGQKVEDLHRPFIDNIVITEGGEEYHRVEDVFDCWFESGSMPFAQVHYPFENKDWFEHHFPADFITEYVGQTRGWFNTLIMLSTALFDKPPFLNCICHGVVLDAETGLKYSKRLKNYKDPKEVMDKFGADALRWLMIASPVMRGSDIGVDPEGKFIRDVVRLAIKPVWNAYNFFCLYANADGVKGELLYELRNGQDHWHIPIHTMDRYILSKLYNAVTSVAEALDAYDTPSATQAVSEFFELLNNWYIRRSKPRFWKGEHDTDKQEAYDTLYTVLHVMSRVMAPLLPMVAEDIYLGLTAKGEHKPEASVHLTDFPNYPRLEVIYDPVIVADMDRVKDICNAALAVRNNRNLRVRLPLGKLTVVARGHAFAEEFSDIIRDEVNVKEVVADFDFDRYASLKLQVNFPKLGARMGQKMKEVIGAMKAGKWTQNGAHVEVLGEMLQEDEYTLLLEAKPEIKDSASPLASNDALVLLDTNVTEELEQEGIARDLVRMIQQARKDASLNVSDRIKLHVTAPGNIESAVISHKDYIMEQTLSMELTNKENKSPLYTTENTIDDQKVVIAFSLAA